MLFNSLAFAVYFPVVFFLYWFVLNKNLKHQNILLLISSYYFYGSWDYRFLGLLIFSTFLDYFTGIKISEARRQAGKKFWLWLSIGINLGFLGVFKYYNFFSTSFAEGLSLLGIKVDFVTLHIILPVGISFYTFHGLSYIIDIYKNRIEPERSFLNYSVFVCFFPLLVAGPIERATHLLPQILKKRKFIYAKAVDGLRQILWGLFKKIVIADNCAPYVDQVFKTYDSQTASTLILGGVLFAFQIYSDFSGYSDIAIGTARLLGINLMQNFAYPFFSRDIAEFWRRWHISLTTWIRDYLFVPLMLAGKRGNRWLLIRNTFIMFIATGLWHGANWTFVFFGLFMAICVTISTQLKTNVRKKEIIAENKLLPSFTELLQMGGTFSLVVVGTTFFRSESINKAFHYLARILDKSLFSIPFNNGNNGLYLCLAIMLAFEWVHRTEEHGLQIKAIDSGILRWAIYFFILSLIFIFGGRSESFIYFQF
ncbi:MAG: MBOAT family protein [Ferruginibacter sp.]|nr:MBOAT family protein [Ferruginibacter sp.]